MPLLEDFGRKLDHRFSRAYENQSTSDWVAANTTLNGMPFSTKGYEFQKAILNDMHPNLNVMKCSQIGLSEVQIRKALAFVTRNRGVSLIFSLPKEDLFRRMSQTRVQPLVMADRVFNLAQDRDSVRSMGIIQIGKSFLYLTSCTEGDATSTAADAVFNDELDLSDQKFIALFNSRLQNSDWKIRQSFSTPTFAAYGIDQEYQLSDQHKYLHRCSACNHWNFPEFNRKFCVLPEVLDEIEDLTEINSEMYNTMDFSKTYVKCEKCSNRLEGERSWVPTYPGRVNSRGYQVTPFSTDRIPIREIVKQLVSYKKQDYIRGWYNTVLGKTYSDAQTQIPLEAIEAAMAKGSPSITELPHDTALAIGIDVGQTCHFVVSDTTGENILLFETLPIGKLKARIAHLFANHRFLSGGIDRLPYTPTSNEIFQTTNKIILPIQYETTRDSDMKLVEDKLGVLSHGAMNRTKILDNVADSFRNYAITLSGYGHQKESIKEHLRNMVRAEEPEKPAVWVKLSGPSTLDHYFHALAFLRAGLRLRPLVMEQLSGGVGEAFGVSLASMSSYLPEGLPGAIKPQRSLHELDPNR